MKRKARYFSIIKLIALSIGIHSLLTSCSSNTNQTRTSTTQVTANDTSQKLEKGPPPTPGRHTKGAFLSKDILLAFIKTSKGNITSHGYGAPFDTLHYNKVVAYEYEGCEEPYPAVLNEQGEFVPVITKQKLLSPEQLITLTKSLTSPMSYGGSTSACFNPHLGIVFYQDTSVSVQINICLGCNYLIASKYIPATESIRSNDNKFAEIGFSKRGRSQIKKLCDDLGYWYEKNSSHDE